MQLEKLYRFWNKASLIKEIIFIILKMLPWIN